MVARKTADPEGKKTVFERVAVLNRGEAAVRFIRASRAWSRIHDTPLDVVAFYTTPDRAAPFVRMANSSVCLGEPLVATPDGGRRSAYLDVERVIALTLESGATAIWPGWGFLAESPELADACVQAGITFIGPSAQAMRLLGDKIEAKKLAEQHGVPVSPWSGGLVADPAQAAEHAERIGYPVLLKATAGGGGRGIRIVHERSELEEAFKSATSEAGAAFGNAGLLVEAFVPVARHVEVQVVADQQGTVWALGTRDCSMQRRNQKVIEEAPAPDLLPEIEAALCDAAITVAKVSKYEGVGTAEFLLEPDGTQFFFLEMNTRLQVEHTVTECVYGYDLVLSQIDIARGEALPADGPPAPRGVAIQARLNAEDPDAGFTPSAGEIARFDAPHGPGIRVDSGFMAGDCVPTEFDSNIAKIIATGDSRGEAFARLATSLTDCVVAIAGGPTNRALLLELLSHSEFREGAVTTRWLDQYLQTRPDAWSRPHLNIALAAAAIGDRVRARRGKNLNFFATAHKGLPRRVSEPSEKSFRYLLKNIPISVTVATMGPSWYRLVCGAEMLDVRAETTGLRTIILEAEGTRYSVSRIGTPTAVYVEVAGVSHRFDRTSDGRVLASIPAAVTQVHVKPGDRVEPGDRVITLEVMKMETAVDSLVGGIVEEVHVDSASRVAAGDLLVTIKGEEGADGEVSANDRPAIFSTSRDKEMSAGEAVRIVQMGLLGYDATDEEIVSASDFLKQAEELPSRRRLFGLLRSWMIQESLFQSGPYDDGCNEAGESSAEQLARFIRHPNDEFDDYSESVETQIRAFLAMHGVINIRRSFALESAIVRLFQAQHAFKRSQRILLSVLAALSRTEDDAEGPAEESSRRVILEQVAKLAVQRNRRLGQAALEPMYLLCDQPRYRLSMRRLSAEATQYLTQMVDSDATEEAREAARMSLSDMPLPILLGLFPEVISEPVHRQQSLLNTVLDRIYDHVGAAHKLRLEGLVATKMDLSDGTTPVGIFVPAPDALKDVLTALPDGKVVDLVLGYVPETDDLEASVATVQNCERVSFVWGGGDDGLRSRTYQLGGDVPEEVTLHRDLHPARAVALEVDRLEAFDLTRLPAPGGLFLALAKAKDGSGDERLFAIGEVERFDPEFDQDGEHVRLPSFEKTFLEALHAMRLGLELYNGQGKHVWNRLTIFMRPTVCLTRQQIESFAHRLGPPTLGLSLEKVVVRAPIAHPDQPEKEPVDSIVEWQNPTGRGPVLSFALPRQRPIRVLSEYERRVVEARRRGLFYPYELIRSLVSDPGSGGFAEGEFEELTLNPAGDELVSVYKRPYGQNEANLVVGRITNRTKRHPEGLSRILVVGDPTRTMGSLAEPECQRIILALDLCEQLGIPLEWVPISSGARISFDSGTENLDWTARVLKRLIEFTQAGGVVNIIVDGTCVGAQSYWNSEATMLQHCRGTLIMTGQGCMLLTGRKALEYSGSVAAATNQGIGGLKDIMGPNGQAQYSAPNLREAYLLLFQHYDLTHVMPGEKYTRGISTSDSADRDVTESVYNGAEGFQTVGEIFSDETNPGRKRPFAIREVMKAVLDQDVEPIERWGAWEGAETAAVFHGQLGGQPVCAVGIESMPVRRKGEPPADGPDTWTSGTLFPQSSRKVARAINAASGVCPIVVFANLSGFDGSPESLRQWQLEYGAEIGRGVVNFKGPILFCVIGRYHGGAYVVFSQTLNSSLESVALEGTFASVIGGGPAAAVVFPGLVRRRTREHPRVKEELTRLEKATARKRAACQARYDTVYREVEASIQRDVANEFDAIHTVERARDVGSLSDVLNASTLRSYLCSQLQKKVQAYVAG